LILKKFHDIIKDDDHQLQVIILELIKELSDYNFSVQEMEFYFYLITEDCNNFSEKIIDNLLFITKNKFEPNYFINFSPVCTKLYETNLDRKLNERPLRSVILPKLNIQPWIPNEGYSMIIWARVESFAKDFYDDSKYSIGIIYLKIKVKLT
jgi:hypothetical protein